MELCRLCGKSKRKAELVITLQEPVQIITFKEFVEYYCRLKLVDDSNLPQSVCEECKTIIVNFSAFTYKVEQIQETFGTKKVSDVNDNVDDEVEKPKVKRIKHLHDDKPIDEAEIASTNANEDQEEVVSKHGGAIVKKIKIVEASRSLPMAEKRKRRQSVYVTQGIQSLLVKSENTISRHLEDVYKIFGRVTEQTMNKYERVTLDKKLLLPKGEVPRSWLQNFDDFKDWQSVTFQCVSHCTGRFEGLYAFFLHNLLEVSSKDRAIACFVCHKEFRNNFYLSSFINHMSRLHYTYIKFCCIVCSKLFENGHYLAQHYLSCHPDEQFPLYPCIQCGLLCQSLHIVNSHKVTCDKKSSKEKS